MKKSPFFYVCLLPTLILSPIITMSCNSWFSVWMLMELNLMAFIPFISMNNKYNKDMMFKYFMAQAIGSSMLLFSSNMLMTCSKTYETLIYFIINMALLMKLGFPPFHYWFIDVMNNSNWWTCLILSTWQKLTPFMLLMFVYDKNLMIIMILYGSLVSTILGLNSQSLRTIMGYSSINHMSWMLLNMMICTNMWLLYFMIYSTISFSIIAIFNKYNIYYINEMHNLPNLKIKVLTFLNLISISGMPPLYGFTIKVYTIKVMMFNQYILLSLLILMMSMLSFIFYTRICLSFMTMFSAKSKLILKEKINKNMIYFIILSMSFLLIWIFWMMLM